MESKDREGRRERKDSGQWAALMDKHRLSGLNVKAFCTAEGVSEASFYKWRQRLEEERTRGGVMFSPIVIGRQTGGGTVVELPGGVLIRFEGLPPAEYLRQLSIAFKGA